MGPKLKGTPLVLNHERLVELMGPEAADELERTARGEPVDHVDMTAEEYARWAETGKDPWPDSSD